MKHCRKPTIAPIAAAIPMPVFAFVDNADFVAFCGDAGRGLEDTLIELLVLVE
jgi:hypothetical protein